MRIENDAPIELKVWLKSNNIIQEKEIVFEARIQQIKKLTGKNIRAYDIPQKKKEKNLTFR